MDPFLTIDCTVCKAPLHVWEYTKHLKGCILIRIHLEPRMTPAMVHFMDQQAAWRRNKEAGHWVPGKDPQAA